MATLEAEQVNKRDLLSQYIIDAYGLGLNPFPIVWSIEDKQAVVHPEHSSEFNLDSRLYWAQENGANGLAYKLPPPYGAFDFDIKNTPNKSIFDDWMRMVRAINDAIFQKVYIEKTRNGGYHVFVKYPGLQHKLPIAKHDGKEVISLYTGGLLLYAYPTPGYEQQHNELCDVKELTDAEFEILVSAAAYFNEDSDEGLPASGVIDDYPEEYENIALQFDLQCSEELFTNILNSIDLFEVSERRYSKKKFKPFLRKGSTADYSAKIYTGKRKRCLIFSASMSGFPTWHDRESADDHRWCLSPTKVLYYKNKCDWALTVSEISAYCQEHDISITPAPDVAAVAKERPDPRLDFPYEVLPLPVQKMIEAQSIQHDYFVGPALIALATGIGNTVELRINALRRTKLIFYMGIVAPTGIGKTPAQAAMFAPLERIDRKEYGEYEKRRQEYLIQLTAWTKDKKNSDQPLKPVFNQILVKNSTVEMLARILSFNGKGCCLVADELSGFLKRLNQYKSGGDDLQAWLEMHTGSPLLVQRITRDETRVDDYTCSIIGGIQTAILEMLSKDDNQHNGFWQRFLFVFPKAQPKPNWSNETVSEEIIENYARLFDTMMEYRNRPEKITYNLSPEAIVEYERWFNKKNEKYNQSTDDGYRGIISKYQDYCLRLALLLQVLYDDQNRAGMVGLDAMKGAIKIIEYFFANMVKAVRILAPNSPVDKLSEKMAAFYAALPESFTTKTAIKIGDSMKIPEGTVKPFLVRHSELFHKQIERGNYEKIY